MLGEGAQDEEAEHKVYLSDSVPSLLPHVPPDVPVTYKHLFSTNFEPANPLRVIAHCDVDAAYAQLSPLAPGDVEPKHYENPNPKTHKISLDMYRRESKKIMDIFQRRVNSGATTGVRTQFDLNPAIADCWTPMPLELLDEHEGQDILFEKASIDESFFDLSVYARKQILHRFPYLDTRAELENMSPDARAKKLECLLPPVPLNVRQELVKKSWTLLGAWWPSEYTDLASQDTFGELENMTWVDVAHAYAAERMISVRKHVLDRLGYTTSAGIAKNKALAKLCSNFRKPCSQTLLLPRFVLPFLHPIAFQKIRFFGGKLGFEIAQEWQHTEVGALWDIPLSDMQSRFGSDGVWIYEMLRGIDRSPVSSRSANRSMMSAKNFQPALTDTAHALRWLSIMSAELSVRLQEERETFPLAYPRSIVLRYFVYGALGARSVQLPFGFVSNDALASEIFHKAEKLWKQGVGEQLSAGASVATLSLSFSGIERQSRDQKQLDVFFKALSPRKKARIAPETHTGTATTPSDHEALETSQIEFANEKIAELAPVQRAASTQQSVLPTAAYDTYKDHETQTEMIQWRCSRCSNIIAIPIFDDLVDETPDTNQPSYQILLDRLREEHRNWHMAVDLAAELVDTPQ
ncbi:DNA-directed DNA polymerase [Malassezia vespertilionis]|uniref:DNA-directed DNA polymerase n=1 Tax=Malassezia vespertilionis TaxID=2020962 RepID=UPI0024B10609|nr:DNA-directed DNA polymerase [Malassezia vespertilionis]WFD07568.1 DNA-directed DNA polymerase [Malassezia vespertilionis]